MFPLLIPLITKAVTTITCEKVVATAAALALIHEKAKNRGNDNKNEKKESKK